MKLPSYITILLLLFAGLTACGGQEEKEGPALSDMSWEQILETAKGQKVTFMMWKGDPFINRYMSEFVVPKVKEQYGIELEVVPGQGSEVVSLLMSELEAGTDKSGIDMMWINGETFFQLREIEGLYGPFTERLPNNKFIDWDNPFINTDFQKPVEGMECPWGNVQMALIYDSDKTDNPPNHMESLESWVVDNPGKFTFSNDFTGMTFLKAFLLELAGKEGLNGSFDEEKYNTLAPKLWAFIRKIQPYLWNKGKSFPKDVAQMHQLYANGELFITMSNNDAEVDNKIRQGLFTKTARAYVPSMGTIQNSHYLGISKLSAKKAAAMAVINFMISPEAQLEKLNPDIWGDGTILAMNKLPADWQEKFNNVPGREFAPKRADIQSRALMEPAPEYMIRLFADFRKEIISN